MKTEEGGNVLCSFGVVDKVIEYATGLYCLL